ncbi:NAD(P)/FAD-dependent oxidoreductase [Gaiella sp.]|uniref:NAD(P)/FAD-dependent oxidoreductase n=1 Tax=Gaiella sp. TaxID=2663207 RepID=UPI00326468B1
MEEQSYDVAVVGGGAAGLSAALVLGRARRRVAVIDAGEPRNAPATHMQGFLSRDGMPPAELLAAARSETLGYGVEIIDDRVIEVTNGFTLSLAGSPALTARRLLLATGAVDRLPDIPGARERWGRDFLHCPYCHGWEVRDQPIGVINTGPGSVDYAHLLRQWSSELVFFTHTHPVTSTERQVLDARDIEVSDGQIAGLSIVNDRLDAVQLTNGSSIARTALFIRPALHARDDTLMRSLGLEVDESGIARVDATGRTTMPGVWAAGNASNPRAQVITAAGEGSAAGIDINNDLVAEDIRNAPSTRSAAVRSAPATNQRERTSR